MNSFCLILLVSTLAILSPCRGDDTTLLPLDGSVLTGSVKFNAYNYYYFNVSSWLNIDITTTITGGSQYGAWTWVGLGYRPVDGVSDWSMGAITGYPSVVHIDHAGPDANATFYVGVQGIGDSESYSISATSRSVPPAPPTELKVDDDIPEVGSTTAFQYTDYVTTAPYDGNFTFSLYPKGSSRSANSATFHVQASVNRLARLAHNDWHNQTSTVNAWFPLTCEYVRQGTRLYASVESDGTHSFDFRVQGKKL